MMPRRRTYGRLAGILVLAVVAFALVPVPAHAAGWFDWLPDPLTFVLDAVLAFLAMLNTLLGQLLAAVQQGLLWILSLKLTAGVSAVRIAWTVIRDLVNMVFILLFIVISFATIFNTTGILKSYYWRQALVPLLIAAIVLNYSLAIGQAVALLSNRVASIAIKILPNPGNILVSSLQPNAVVLQLQNEVGPSSAKITDTRKSLTDAEEAHMKKCLNETKEIVVKEGIIFDDYETVRKSLGDCNLEIVDARNAVGAAQAGQDLTDAQKAALESHQAAYSTFANSNENRLALISSAAFNIFMMLLIICCLLTAFVFLAVRILVIWALLALSPLAWMGYALPGKEHFHKWWTTFIAWNVFGPLYIFALIPGMHMLIGQGEMMTALNNAGSAGGGGLIQLFLFQGFALLIFVGGLGLALNSSFKGAIRGTAFVGGALEKYGAFDATGSGTKAWGLIGRKTGVTNAARARWEKTKQQFGDVKQGAASRMGRFGMSDEENLAKARAARGVRGGAEEVESLRAKRINTEKETLEQRMKIDRAKAEANGEPFDEASWLEDYKDSTNPDVRLASREMLMSRGKLGTDDMIGTAEEYAKISPLARQAYVERASTRLTEKAGKSGPEGFKDAGEALAALDSGIMNDKQKEKFLGTLQRNQPLIAAEVAIRAPANFPGKTPASIVAGSFSGMSSSDVGKLLTSDAANPAYMGPPGSPERTRLEGLVASRAGKQENYYAIITEAPGFAPTIDAWQQARGITRQP